MALPLAGWAVRRRPPREWLGFRERGLLGKGRHELGVVGAMVQRGCSTAGKCECRAESEATRWWCCNIPKLWNVKNHKKLKLFDKERIFF